MPEVDKEVVDLYWEQVTPTILGPYMMDGYGFPASAGNYRFGIEVQIVEKLIQSVDRNGAALDLGSGMGYWAEEFARSFTRVDALEGSSPLSPYNECNDLIGNRLQHRPGEYFIGARQKTPSTKKDGTQEDSAD